MPLPSRARTNRIFLNALERGRQARRQRVSRDKSRDGDHCRTARGEVMASIERKMGRHDGIRLAITWLHGRAKEMNDPHARGVLNSAAFSLGVEMKQGDLLEGLIARDKPSLISRLLARLALSSDERQK